MITLSGQVASGLKEKAPELLAREPTIVVE
jgi:hypothetical protein